MATTHFRSSCLGFVLTLLAFAQPLLSQTSPSTAWVPSSPSAKLITPFIPPMSMPSTAPLFLESETYTSTIYLVNQITVAVQTDVTLYDTSGSMLTTKHLNLLPNSQQSVSIKQILSEGGFYSQAGSVEVLEPQYPGAILGQLSIARLGRTSTTSATTNRGYLDEELFMPESNGSQTLRSVIDSPANSPIVAVTNVSSTQNHTLHTSCLTTSGPAVEKTFLLQPKQTSLVRACSTVADAVFSADALDAQFILKPESATGLAGERTAGITITTEGAPGELAAFGFVAHNDTHGSYFSSMNFSDPNQLHASGFVFAGVPVGPSLLLPGTSYTPEVALTNFSAALQTVTVLLATGDGSASTMKQVASVSVPAGASKLVKLPGLTGNPAWQNSFVVRSSGQPGDVIAKMMFKGTGALPNIELIAKDEHDTHNAGDHPWTTENGTRSTLFLFNHSGRVADVTVRIGAVGTAWLKAYTLQPNETKAVSIGDLVAAGAKGSDGKALPKTLTQGEVGWWAPNGKYSEVTGRVVQMDAVGTVARNFSCGNYAALCGINFADNSIILSFAPGSSSSTTIQSDPTFCTEVTDAPPSNGCGSGYPTNNGANMTFSYSSNDTSIATVANGGGSSTWTGTGIGNTYGNVTATAYSSNSCSGGAPVQTNPSVTISGPSNVLISNDANTPTILLTASGYPSGGTYSWSTSSSALSPTSASGPTINVSGNSAGQGTMNVRYTYNGSSGSASQMITVQIPTSLPVIQTISNGAYTSCPQGYTGWQRRVIRQLTDQNLQPIVVQGQQIPESVTVGTPNTLNVANPNFNSNANTDAQGQQIDTFNFCSSYCPKSSGTTNLQQTIQDTSFSPSYPLGTYTITLSCSSIAVNGMLTP